MAGANVALAPTTPWTLRLFDRAPVAPIWVGLGISLAWFAFYLLYTVLFGDGVGRFEKLGGATWSSEIFWSLLIGMAPTVTAYSLRGAARDLRDLAPALRLPAGELEALQRELGRVSPAIVTGAGVLGLVFAVLANGFNTGLWVDGRIPPPGDPALTWMIGRNAVNAWLIARAVVLEVLLAQAFSGVGGRLPAVDLLDRAPLAPFRRRALRSVLLWMLFISIFAPLPFIGVAESAFFLGLAFIVVLAGVAFLVPVWGAHARIREAKAAELARVRRAIADSRERVLASHAAELRGGRLADLVAYERLVADAGEWPFGFSAVLRFMLYTAIGLGSWMGAAIVERLLETALN